jgi:hypothetical protein
MTDVADPTNKKELLDRIQAGYQQFNGLLTNLSQDQMTQKGVIGEWSVKDLLTHLTAWELYAIMRIQIALHGLPLELHWTVEEQEGFDRKNEQIYAANRDKPLAQVQPDFLRIYHQMLDFIAALSESDLFAAEGHVGQRLGYPAWQLIAGNTYEHYAEHGESLREWLDKGGAGSS